MVRVGSICIVAAEPARTGLRRHMLLLYLDDNKTGGLSGTLGCRWTYHRCAYSSKLNFFTPIDICKYTASLRCILSTGVFDPLIVKHCWGIHTLSRLSLKQSFFFFSFTVASLPLEARLLANVYISPHMRTTSQNYITIAERIEWSSSLNIG